MFISRVWSAKLFFMIMSLTKTCNYRQPHCHYACAATLKRMLNINPYEDQKYSNITRVVLCDNGWLFIPVNLMISTSLLFVRVWSPRQWEFLNVPGGGCLVAWTLSPNSWVFEEQNWRGYFFPSITSCAYNCKQPHQSIVTFELHFVTPNLTSIARTAD